jgi:ribose transport system permease protein
MTGLAERIKRGWGRRGGRKESFWAVYGIPIVFAVICLVLTFTTRSFMSVDNIVNVLRQISITSIAAIGTTFILISGGIDISMGAVMASAGMMSMALIAHGSVPVPLATVAGLGVGAVAGLFNGFATTKVKIPPFIATLSTMSMLRGACFVYSGGYTVYGDYVPEGFQAIGRGYVGIIPVPVILMILTYVIAHLVSNHTIFGTCTYSIGCNEKASNLAGIKVERVRLFLYMTGGLTSALAGIILTARLNSAQANAANGMEFDIITAVVLGGTSIYGGRGKVHRTLLGALMIGVMNNGMTLLNIDIFYRMIASGAILFVALALDRINARKS